MTPIGNRENKNKPIGNEGKNCSECGMFNLECAYFFTMKSCDGRQQI